MLILREHLTLQATNQNSQSETQNMAGDLLFWQGIVARMAGNDDHTKSLLQIPSA